MPKGIYIRTEKHKEILHKNIKKAHDFPKTSKQIEHCQKMGLASKGMPKTPAQREASRRNGFRNHPLEGNNTVEHHNDLKHGAERPDDVTYMANSQHMSLHANLRVKNGTHHLLAKNRKMDNE